MQITEVQLRNIGPHRELDVKFNAGLIGITGANGSGKSTLVNSIYAALTNDFKRIAEVKADAITKGSTDPSFIRILGTHRGHAFELIRRLRGGKSEPAAEFLFAGVLYTKATDVEEAITAQLNISKSIIDKYVFVDQWGMFSFLDQTASERAKTFQYLCGTEIAATIHKVCTTYVTKQTDLTIMDNSLELEEACVTLTDSVEQHRKQATEAKGKRLDEVNLTECNNVLAQYREHGDLQSRLVQAQVYVKSFETPFTEGKAELIAIATHLKPQTDWLDNHKEQVLVAHARVSAEAAQQRIAVKLTAAKRELAQLATVEFEKPAIDSALYVEEQGREAEQKQRHELRFKLDQVKLLLANKLKQCVSCCQPISEEYVAKVKVEAASNQQQLDRVVARLTYSVQVDGLLQQYQETVEAQEQRKVQLRNLCAELSERVTEFDENMAYAAALVLVQKATTVQAEVEQLTITIRKTKKEQDRLEGRLLEARDSVAAMQEKQKRSWPSAQQAEEAHDQLEAHAEEEKRYRESVGAYREAKRALELQTELLAKLRYKLAGQAKIRNLLTTIAAAGDVFHWNGLPKVVSQANLELLVGDINENLSLFNDPFCVEADDDLSFKVWFPGKPAVKAKQLSGGQKVVLAIAFRAALDRVFGHDVGMLFLDEPTAGLDADNVNYFHTALQQLARKLGTERQLIVITHVTALGGAFDQLVEVRKD